MDKESGVYKCDVDFVQSGSQAALKALKEPQGWYRTGHRRNQQANANLKNLTNLPAIGNT